MGRREEYFVEVILNARRKDKGEITKFNINSPHWQYLVKWAGYPDSENSYEPVSGLADCKRLVQSFWEAVGVEAFLSNAPGFVVHAPDDWIRKEKLYFAALVPLDEVKAQNRDPKRKRTPSISRPRTPKTPAPGASILKPPSRGETSPKTTSPKKVVSFAPDADVSVVPKITDVENTAQWHRASRKRAYDDSDDDEPPMTPNVSNHNTSSPTSGLKLKIRIPRPIRPAEVPVGYWPRLHSQLILFFQPVLEYTEPAPPTEPTTESPAASPTDSIFSSHGLSSPPPTPSPSTRGIKFVEDLGIINASLLSTKSRLAKATVAPAIPRASPVPAPPPKEKEKPVPSTIAEDDAMDVDSGPQLVPDHIMNRDTGDADDLGPMLASMHPYDDDANCPSGFYDANEDRYAGLPKNGDPLPRSEDDMDMDTAPYPDPDQFLDTIILPPVQKAGYDYRPNRPLNSQLAPSQKWCWTGRVTIGGADTAQTLCERATLTDAPDASTPCIASFVLSTQPLELTNLFDIEDIIAFLTPCQPTPHQYARLTAEGVDAENLQVFSEYMARKEQAVLLPAIMRSELIGALLFISSSSTQFLSHLGIPTEFYADRTCIIVTLFHGDHDAPAIGDHYKQVVPPVKRTVERAVLSPTRWRQSIREEKAYHLALRIIQLPAYVREFAFKYPSTVWCRLAGSDDEDGREDQETQLLRRILKRKKAGIVPCEDPSADVHTVFMHVGALRNIHNLPHLMERRLRPDVRFCLYGTHETVHPSRWGFKEIYLLGGVVTFTPEALVDDPWGVLRTLREIDAHPLWTCYLLPQVVGMAHKLSQSREDDSPEYREALPYTLDQLFSAIEKGYVGLFDTPPNDPSDEQISRWVIDHVLLRPQTTEAVLEHCSKAFEDAYMSSLPANWATLAKNDVLADMRRMQVQPTVVQQYRRFVVLDASPDSSRYRAGDGIEWEAVRKFSFQDSFKCERR
ncbi:hypothetical protein C8R46DRAFT_1184034 [Mycena filopes]|nr:hypothetical protein C8R46DRAFT_1184034 [Mycena filopes]